MLAWVDVSEQTGDAGEPEQAEEAAGQARHASRSLRNGLISLALLSCWWSVCSWLSRG
jgi:hypothetical protein